MLIGLSRETESIYAFLWLFNVSAILSSPKSYLVSYLLYITISPTQSESLIIYLALILAKR